MSSRVISETIFDIFISYYNVLIFSYICPVYLYATILVLILKACFKNDKL